MATVNLVAFPAVLDKTFTPDTAFTSVGFDELKEANVTEAVIAVKVDASAREVIVDATVVLASSDEPASMVV